MSMNFDFSRKTSCLLISSNYTLEINEIKWWEKKTKKRMKMFLSKLKVDWDEYASAIVQDVEH